MGSQLFRPTGNKKPAQPTETRAEREARIRAVYKTAVAAMLKEVERLKMENENEQ